MPWLYWIDRLVIGRFVCWPFERLSDPQLLAVEDGFGCREETSDQAAVLHYTYNRFEDLKSRRDRCDCAPTEEDAKRCFILPFDRMVCPSGACTHCSLACLLRCFGQGFDGPTAAGQQRCMPLLLPHHLACKILRFLPVSHWTLLCCQSPSDTFQGGSNCLYVL